MNTFLFVLSFIFFGGILADSLTTYRSFNFGSTERIVNGTNGSLFSFPFVVSIHSKYRSACSVGTLVSPRLVLTAANCADKLNSSFVRAGSNFKNEGGQISQVRDVLINERFNFSGKYDYDAALLVLNRPFNLSYTLKPVNISTSKVDLINFELAFVLGWGNGTSGARGENLQYFDSMIYLGRFCEKYQGHISNTTFCAGRFIGGRNTCRDDRGAPLITPEYKQIGIASWSTPCNMLRPGTFTSVYSVSNWILNKIKKYN